MTFPPVNALIKNTNESVVLDSILQILTRVSLIRAFIADSTKSLFCQNIADFFILPLVLHSFSSCHNMQVSLSLSIATKSVKIVLG